MKDSGIEWIGEIPSTWSIDRLRNFYSFEKGKQAALYTKEYIAENVGNYPVYSGQTESNGIMGFVESFDYDLDECIFTTTVGANVMTLKLLCGKFCLSQNCLIMISKNLCNNYYMFYFLNSLFQYEKSAIPSYMQPSLRISDLKRYSICFPNLKIQQNIADYLDDKCAKIDSLIAHEEATIEELKAYKQSVISEAVTKGLDKSAPMKDSGVEWIGKIPECWEIRRLKSLGIARNGLTYSPEDICDGRGTLVLRSSNIKNGKIVLNDNVYVSCYVPNMLKVKEGDILICARNGSKELVGKNAIIANEDAAFGAFMMIFRCSCPKWVHYVLNSNIFDYYLGTFFSSTINQLTKSNFNDIRIVFCNNEKVRKEIENYLDKKCAEIDNLISIKQKKIEKLKEYKKSLIYEYVTGKKEVV